MRRLHGTRRPFGIAAAVVAFASTLAFTALPAAADRDDHGMGQAPCPRGAHWVPPHRDKHGHWVRGHCRHDR